LRQNVGSITKRITVDKIRNLNAIKTKVKKACSGKITERNVSEWLIRTKNTKKKGKGNRKINT